MKKNSPSSHSINLNIHGRSRSCDEFIHSLVIILIIALSIYPADGLNDHRLERQESEAQCRQEVLKPNHESIFNPCSDLANPQSTTTAATTNTHRKHQPTISKIDQNRSDHHCHHPQDQDQKNVVHKKKQKQIVDHEDAQVKKKRTPNLIPIFKRFLLVLILKVSHFIASFTIKILRSFASIFSKMFQLIFCDLMILTWDEIIFPAMLPIRILFWLMIIKPLWIIKTIFNKLKPLIIYLISAIFIGIFIGRLGCKLQVYISDKFFPIILIKNHSPQNQNKDQEDYKIIKSNTRFTRPPSSSKQEIKINENNHRILRNQAPEKPSQDLDHQLEKNQRLPRSKSEEKRKAIIKMKNKTLIESSSSSEEEEEQDRSPLLRTSPSSTNLTESKLKPNDRSMKNIGSNMNDQDFLSNKKNKMTNYQSNKSSKSIPSSSSSTLYDLNTSDDLKLNNNQTLIKYPTSKSNSNSTLGKLSNILPSSSTNIPDSSIMIKKKVSFKND